MRTVVFSSALLLLGACATAETGGLQSVSFISDPPGATVETSTGQGCQPTPCTLTMDRETVFEALFRLGAEVRIAAVGASADALEPNPVSVTFSEAAASEPLTVVSGAQAEPVEPAELAEAGPAEAGQTTATAAAPSVPIADKPLFEGSPMAFTEAELAAFCAEPWTTRLDDASGRTEYNPCRAPEAFR